MAWLAKLMAPAPRLVEVVEELAMATNRKHQV